MSCCGCWARADESPSRGTRIRATFLCMKPGAKTRAKTGRPPRRDRPVRIDTRMAGALRAWLKRRARREGRSEGAIIEDAVRAYQRRVEKGTR